MVILAYIYIQHNIINRVDYRIEGGQLTRPEAILEKCAPTLLLETYAPKLPRMPTGRSDATASRPVVETTHLNETRVDSLGDAYEHWPNC